MFIVLWSKPASACRIFPLAAFPVSRPAYLVLLHHQPPAVGCGAVFLIATESFTPNNATLQQHNLICSCSLYFHYPSALAPSQERTHE